MSSLPKRSAAGIAAAAFAAILSANALAQTAPSGSTSNAQAAPSFKPLTPQGPLPAKPAAAPTAVTPESKTLATRPLPAKPTPPQPAPQAVPKKCADQRPQGDC